jgi:hypothetical protein
MSKVAVGCTLNLGAALAGRFLSTGTCPPCVAPEPRKSLYFLANDVWATTYFAAYLRSAGDLRVARVCSSYFMT